MDPCSEARENQARDGQGQQGIQCIGVTDRTKDFFLHPYHKCQQGPYTQNKTEGVSDPSGKDHLSVHEAVADNSIGEYTGHGDGGQRRDHDVQAVNAQRLENVKDHHAKYYRNEKTGKKIFALNSPNRGKSPPGRTGKEASGEQTIRSKVDAEDNMERTLDAAVPPRPWLNASKDEVSEQQGNRQEECG